MLSNIFEIIGAISVVLSALIALFQLIPGNEPESTLQKILDVILKYSRK